MERMLYGAITMKGKVYVVTEAETVKGVYTNFENALKIAKAYSGRPAKHHRIQTVDCDCIDWDVIYKYIKGIE